MAGSYSIYVCPFCREQMDPEYGASHTHEDVLYEAVALEVVSGESWDWASVDEARVRQEREDAERKVRAAADKAEIDRMEAEWRESAPPEQVEAWEEQKRRTVKTMAGFDAIFRESTKELAADLNRTSYMDAVFAPTPEERERIEAKIRREDREREERVIREFEEHGPARIGFWRLRDARQRLAEMPPS